MANFPTNPSIGDLFETFLYCIFQTTAMNRDFLKGLLRSQISTTERQLGVEIPQFFRMGEHYS